MQNSPNDEVEEVMDSGLKFPIPLDFASTSEFLGKFCNSIMFLKKFMAIEDI